MNWCHFSSANTIANLSFSMTAYLGVGQSSTCGSYRSAVLEKFSAKTKVACITMDDELLREKLFHLGESFLLLVQHPSSTAYLDKIHSEALKIHTIKNKNNIKKKKKYI